MGAWQYRAMTVLATGTVATASVVAPVVSPAPAYAAGSRHLVFAAVGYASGGATLLVGRLGGTAHRIFRGPYPDSVDFPAVSPGGGRVAYLEDVNGAGPSVAVINVDGTHHRVLWHNNGCCDASPPVWSPDGKRIYFGRYNNEKGTFFNAYVVASDGSTNAVAVTNGHHARPEAMRHDGRQLAFDFMQPGDRWMRTGVMRPDGSDRHGTGPGNLWGATWRPKTATVAVSRVLRDDGGGVTIQIQLLDTRTGHFHALTRTQSAASYGAAYPIAWSSDGSHLFYEHYSYRDGDQVSPRIFRIRADGTGRSDVTPSLPSVWATHGSGRFALQGR